jgi:hypothetical protein
MVYFNCATDSQPIGIDCNSLKCIFSRRNKCFKQERKLNSSETSCDQGWGVNRRRGQKSQFQHGRKRFGQESKLQQSGKERGQKFVKNLSKICQKFVKKC